MSLQEELKELKWLQGKSQEFVDMHEGKENSDMIEKLVSFNKSNVVWKQKEIEKIEAKLKSRTLVKN
jgi:hypothetical protein